MFVKMMMMEGREEVVACNNDQLQIIKGREEVVACNNDQLQIIKGKRTKRPRPLSPPELGMTSTTTTNSDESRGFDPAFASPATSVELTESSTEEEEDMANCLILLAQGQTRNKPLAVVSELPVSIVPSTTTTSNKSFHGHQCKTCNRCFPSFQALGGHRASHKKPKVANVDQEQNKGSVVLIKEDDDHQQFNNMNTTLSLQLTSNKPVLSNTNNKSKVHECSICGAEFSSGQALGGHMRRHRTINNPPTTGLSVGIRSCPESDDRDDQSKKPRTLLQLDLNLPAPEDELHRETKFSFPSKEKLLVFSASSLVDCHY